MPVYEFRNQELPEIIADYFRTLTGEGSVYVDFGAGTMTYRIEADDLWDLAQRTRDLKQELQAIVGHGLVPEFKKPVEAIDR